MCAGLFIPYISFISFIISGSNPCAPRYFESKFEESVELIEFKFSPSPPPENLAVASTAAGVAFSNSMVGAVHGIGHTVGALAHVHHGMAMAILLPHVMEYNLEKIGELYSELLLSLAGAETFASTPKNKRAEASIEFIKNLNKTLNSLCGMPITLSEAGVNESQLEEIAKRSLNDGAMILNPEDMNPEEVLSVLKKAF